MPKRRRLLTPLVYKHKSRSSDVREKEVTTARGRLKGALMGALEPNEESDESDHTPVKRERQLSQDYLAYSSDEDDIKSHSPPRQSYVLKLFDRSVDLSQFNDDSPLYPICRAWIANQPKANYKQFELNNWRRYEEPDFIHDSVELPGPEGPPISKIPELTVEQKARDKDNINLNYREAPPPSREQLLQAHLSRWSAIRGAWLDQAAKAETRYAATQNLLSKINVK